LKKTLTSNTAYDYLMESEKLNPGNWVNHSLYTAKAAKYISEKLNNLDSDLAEAYGYIHDIGRRVGVYKMRHVIDGYNFLIKEGYPDAARICLTHSYPTKSIEDAACIWDGTDEDYLFVKNYIDDLEFSKYDKLLQLCDALALPSGYTIIERRLIDVSLRHGINDRTIKRWRAFFSIQNYFEQELGCSIYSVLPGIEENTLIKPISESLDF